VSEKAGPALTPPGLPAVAADHFNRKAEELLGKLEPERTLSRPTGVPHPTSAAHEPVVYNFGPADVQINTIWQTDPFGEDLARSFSVEKGFIGLAGEAFKEAKELWEQLSSRRELGDVLSERFIADTLFDWFRERHTGVGAATFLERLSAAAQKSVRPRTVSHPIAHLVIQSPFVIGRVRFDFFKADLFDQLDRWRATQRSDATPELKDYDRQIRQKYQGKVFCSMVVNAEPIRCVEIARCETDLALAVLRCFSPTALLPQAACYFDRMGAAHIPGYEHFLFEEVLMDGRTVLLPLLNQGSDEKKQTWTVLSDRDLQMLGSSGGLGAASELLRREELSSLEEQLLGSYQFFSRAIGSADLHERLVFCLVSLESLLLRDSTEPIGVTLGNRVAYLAFQPKDDRKKARDTIKAAYGLRSRFLHHGLRSSENWKVLADLQLLVWCALQNVFGRIKGGCKTKQDLIERLDDELME
jgi:hypothetical protein